ncbi:hypothetical protein [Candidatus Halobonum tyrrellensis]|nr:hypothetical protein [Candidatus Halobonum tyrrellensis]
MTVAVSRSAPGDLAAGVETKLRRIDAVRGVESVDLRGIRPGLNDLTVDVEATLAVDADGDADATALEAAFDDAFGVSDVSVAAVRSVPPDPADGAAADAL